MGSASPARGCVASPGTGEVAARFGCREPGIKGGMSEPWIPSLTVREHGPCCRLCLAGDAWGDGATLQEAADDLVARVMRLARAIRTGGWTCTQELGPPDRRWLD